jgi:hypothetical protein
MGGGEGPAQIVKRGVNFRAGLEAVALRLHQCHAGSISSGASTHFDLIQAAVNFARHGTNAAKLSRAGDRDNARVAWNAALASRNHMGQVLMSGTSAGASQRGSSGARMGQRCRE